MKQLLMRFLVVGIVCLLMVPAVVQAREFTFTTSDGVALHVTVKGQGMPCVYMHGGPGSGAFWLEYFSGEMLEKNFQMIYVDQRGTSRSGGTLENDYSLARQIQDFEELRQELGIAQWFTMGHSFGGVLQMAYARQYPQSLKGMLLINCTLSLNESIEETIPYAIKELAIEDTAPYYDKSKYPLDRLGPLFGMMREKGIFWKIHYQQEKNYHTMDSVMNSVPNWNWSFSQRALSMSDYYQNFKPVAATVKVPVLVFWGEKDYAVGPTHFKDVRFPEQLVYKFKGGHVPFMEGEKDLEKAIRQYLKKYGKRFS